MRIAVLLAPVAALLFLACVPKPAKAYSPDEVGKLESLEELMRINAAKADPLFGKAGQTSFTDSEWAAMADAGVLIEASGKRTAERFKGQGEFDDGFADYGNQLAAQAKALADAAGAKDAAGASKAGCQQQREAGNEAQTCQRGPLRQRLAPHPRRSGEW